MTFQHLLEMLMVKDEGARLFFRSLCDFPLHFSTFFVLITDFIIECFFSTKGNFLGFDVGWNVYFLSLFDIIFFVLKYIFQMLKSIISQLDLLADIFIFFNESIKLFFDIMKHLFNLSKKMFKDLFTIITNEDFLKGIGGSITALILASGAEKGLNFILKSAFGKSINFEAKYVKQCALLAARGLLVAKDYMLKFVSFVFSFFMKTIVFFYSYGVILLINYLRILQLSLKLSIIVFKGLGYIIHKVLSIFYILCFSWTFSDEYKKVKNLYMEN